MIAIGGWNETPTKFSNMSANAANRQTFIASVVQFLLRYDFDGLDIDWEYPAARGGSPADKPNFTLLVKVFPIGIGRGRLGNLKCSLAVMNGRRFHSRFFLS